MRELPEIIAEIGVNYYDIANQMGVVPVQAAREMVRAAKNVGIGVVKFQTYKAEKLAAENSPAYCDWIHIGRSNCLQNRLKENSCSANTSLKSVLSNTTRQ